MTSLLGKEVTVLGRHGSDTFTLPNTFDLPVTDPYRYQSVWYYPLSVIACVTAPPTTTTPIICEAPFEAPSEGKVKVGSKVKLLGSRAAFENAFRGKSYVWHPAMTNLLGKEVTVVSRPYGGTFGLPKSDPNHNQPVWYYPLSVIACVAPPPTTTTTTTTTTSICLSSAVRNLVRLKISVSLTRV